MPLLPFDCFVIDLPAAPDEVRDRLLMAVTSQRGDVTGTVNAGTFELRPILAYGNSFAPVARGTFSTGISGTRVQVSMRMLSSVSVFMALWLAFAAAIFVVAVVVAIRDPARSWIALVPLAFFALGYGLMILAFSYEARRLRATLERLLVSGSLQPAPHRRDLSWLSDFRLRNADPRERRFNRVFLSVCAVSGALTIVAWERTAGACSNPQYHRPSEFSCPSHARIGLTWVLGVLLVTTGFASRVAIHRRLRRAYVPLVLLTAAVGAAAAWLLTHHPHWGVPR